ncbi:hypothetical protein MLD38_003735 [Melastoma candidum]|uniref:Uncharacterized protein n=1 Tax=Melastoma candidum TaxID=119954 RepID=A0ACB9S4W0_9MYRT|nr:hypothetical protein MLD38_003735 [Melastoma candidum]
MLQYEDIVQLEWLSTFVEDSFSGGGGLAFPAADPGLLPKNDDPRPFQTSSPVSVLESSSSSSNASLCSGEKTSPCCLDAVIPRKYGRARSKRPRPASFSPRPAMIQLVSPQPQCSVPENDHNVPVKIQCELSESFTGSYNSAIDILKEAVTVEPMTPKKKKKKKIEPTLPPRLMTTSKVEDKDPLSAQAPIRKCLHCHITKTPQWRAGPLGPKTLCNACGVRYKSGRLFPEYRPAASPTFVPSLHSNSHKKVLEMRSKTGGLIIRDTLPELIPNTSAIVQMDCM